MGDVRTGPLSQLNMYAEATENSDSGITDGYIVPITKADGVSVKQDLLKAFNYNGARRFQGAVPGPINQSGTIPVGLEFRFLARILKQICGAAGYTRYAYASGFSLHEFQVAGKPGTVQLERAWNETTAKFARTRAVKLGGVNFSASETGAAEYTVPVVGRGARVVPFPTAALGTVHDDGYEATSYFNGSLSYAGTALTDIAMFSFKLDNALKRVPGYFASGVAAAVAAGSPEASGELGVLFDTVDNLNKYLDAINQTQVLLSFLYSDLDPSLCNAFCEFRMPTVKFGSSEPMAGGEDVPTIQQPFQALTDATNGKLAAELIVPGLGPFTLDGTHKTLGLEIDGATEVDTDLGTTSTSVDDAITALQANSSLTAEATIDKFCGRIRITSKTKGASSSVQVITGATNSCHTQLALTGTAITGKAGDAVFIRILNDVNADV